LHDAVQLLLDECRMVLPGIQALFGFQLVAIINPGFEQKFSPVEQRLHLAAILLVAVAIALIMTPAAYHRQTSPREARGDFVALSTRLLLASMFPLAAGICIDFYLVCRVIVPGPWYVILPAVLLVVFAGLWFWLPHSRRLRDRLTRDA
jgi:hypothetical protein